MSDRLLNCPFCGNKDISVSCDNYGNFCVDCECGCNLCATFATPEEATEHWNRRAGDE